MKRPPQIQGNYAGAEASSTPSRKNEPKTRSTSEYARGCAVTLFACLMLAAQLGLIGFQAWYMVQNTEKREWEPKNS